VLLGAPVAWAAWRLLRGMAWPSASDMGTRRRRAPERSQR